MITIKIIYNKKYIDDLDRFNKKLESLSEKYNNNFLLEESLDKKFDLEIDDKIVYTLDDNFSINPITTDVIIKKIDFHIYSINSSKRFINKSKFDDVDIIDC